MTLLLERFARVLEVDPSRIEPATGPGNTSLGATQAEVLRRVNVELPAEVHRRYIYGDVVKRSFSTGVLGAQERRKILVPEKFREWCEEVAGRQVDALAAAGYHVEGSLADLRCHDSAFAEDFRRPSESEVAAASVSALAAILTARGRDVAQHRHGRVRVARPTLLGRLRHRLRS